MRCWIAPRDVPPGARFGEAIVGVIERSVAVVLIFSEHANTTEHVMSEVEPLADGAKPGQLLASPETVRVRAGRFRRYSFVCRRLRFFQSTGLSLKQPDAIPVSTLKITS
jgi:hypothetical protein